MLYDKIIKLKKHLPKLSIYEENAIVITIYFIILSLKALRLNTVFPNYSSYGSQYEEVNSVVNVVRFIPIIAVLFIGSISWGIFFFIKHRKKKKEEKEEKKEPIISITKIEEKITDAGNRSFRENVFALRDGLESLYDTLSGKLQKL